MTATLIAQVLVAPTPSRVSDDASAAPVRHRGRLAIFSTDLPEELGSGNAPANTDVLFPSVANGGSSGGTARDYFPAQRMSRVVASRPPADAPTLLDCVKAWAADWDGEDES